MFPFKSLEEKTQLILQHPSLGFWSLPSSSQLIFLTDFPPKAFRNILRLVCAFEFAYLSLFPVPSLSLSSLLIYISSPPLYFCPSFHLCNSLWSAGKLSQVLCFSLSPRRLVTLTYSENEFKNLALATKTALCMKRSIKQNSCKK